ncbi:DNA repair protein RadC [Thermodesulfobacteriota bacterium]
MVPAKTLPHYHGHRKRMKDRFLSQGLSGFSEYEALELILLYAIRRKDVKTVAKRLLDRFNSFPSVLEADSAELQQVKGIGPHAALLLNLIRDSSDYYLRGTIAAKRGVSSPNDVLDYCRSSMAHLGDEQFRVFYLNAKNEILDEGVIQEGTVDQTAVYPRKIMERALQAKAVALICVHNHPSGYPDPSRHDAHLTKTIHAAAKMFGIRLHDHVIIARHGYYSFREEGHLGP